GYEILLQVLTDLGHWQLVPLKAGKLRLEIVEQRVLGEQLLAQGFHAGRVVAHLAEQVLDRADLLQHARGRFAELLGLGAEFVASGHTRAELCRQLGETRSGVLARGTDMVSLSETGEAAVLLPEGRQLSVGELLNGPLSDPAQVVGLHGALT